MRRFALYAGWIVLALTHGLYAGPLFDDYLNYLRPGPATPPGEGRVLVRQSAAVGQSLSVGKDVGEIYRIGLRAVYETWTSGETVTLTLYDSPARNAKLAQYAIDESTSRVQPIYDPKLNGETKDRVVYWQLRAPTKGRTSFYFELTVAGGDGEVAFQAAAGRGTECSYLVHIKPVADRAANLREFFSGRLDLNRPELAAVKAAVQAADWERAIAEAGKHFRSRKELWQDYAAILQEKPKLDADTELADLVMHNQLRHVETKKPVPWRPEAYWIPEFKTDRAQPKQGADPNLYTWHVDRTLAAAYTNTGKPEYARRCIELRMQFILGNPSPKTSGLPWYFELWNDRTAAARAPGHGLLPYVRLHNYDGWTADERLVFFSFLEDNARWDYRADSGANWGAEAARSCYEFGLKFPEWKMSPEYVRWGTGRLAEIVLADVRGDGTSTEAAVKYHAMVARRLRGMLEDHVEGRVKLEEGVLAKLMKSVEGMYEHMAYTLMPNSFVVMCGDSWYENFAYGTTLGIDDLKNVAKTLQRFRQNSDPVVRLLRSKLRKNADEPLKLVAAWDGKSAPSEEVQRALLGLLNKVIAPAIGKPGDQARPEHDADKLTEAQAWPYDEKAFAGIKLRAATQNLLNVRPIGGERELLARLLIEDAWPDEIREGYLAGELYSAARLVKRPDFTWIASQGLEGTPPAQVSKVFPGGGYFIMRSDFGAGPKPGSPGPSPAAYRDSRQLFIHNGNWFGSHGHWDLTSVNLYAFGRPLIVDPGQYEHEPPAGINHYWESKIHSMLVPDGRDCKRQAGPSEWSSSAAADFFDGRHDGYRKEGDTGAVRRRIVFVKPDYFIVDDSAETETSREWAQVWNLSDPDARIEAGGGSISTTFPTGGNVLILNQDAARFTVDVAEGITSAKSEIPRTRIYRLSCKTDRPRFQTLVYPYQGGKAPELQWQVMRPDRGKADDLMYAVQVHAPAGEDWIGFGHRGAELAFSAGKHKLQAASAMVRGGANPTRFAWADGCLLAYAGKPLAQADAPVHSLGVCLDGTVMSVEASEPEATLRIDVGQAKSFTLNGKPVAQPTIKEGMFWPFADQPRAMVADDRDAFEPITKGEEWECKTDPASWAGTYLQHETDPGRHESGNFVLEVPENGKYRLEVYLPRVLVTPSDRVEYKVNAEGKPAAQSGPLVAVRSAGRTHALVVNHQAMCGWTPLGEFTLRKGKLRIMARNATETDGVYFIADAMRLISVE